jgi:hypothetical protein
VRTPEQQAADQALADAIQAAQNAYGFTGLTVGYVVAVAVVEYDDGGEQCSGTCHHVPAGQHWVTTLGTIHATHLRLQALFTGTEDE